MVCPPLPADGCKTEGHCLPYVPVRIPAYEHNHLVEGTAHFLSDKLFYLQPYPRIIKLTLSDYHNYLLQEPTLFHHNLHKNYQHLKERDFVHRFHTVFL